MIEKEKFQQLVDAVDKLESEKKEIAEEIKDKIAMAAQDGNADKKALAKAVKEFLRYKKDSQTYIAEDLEVSNILVSVIKEFQED